MDVNIVAKANGIIKSCDTAYLGVIDESGCPHVSTVTPINPDNIFEAHFATGAKANKTRRLQSDCRASVCLRAGGNNITLTGEAKIMTDAHIKKQCWMQSFINHFPDGETDPNYCVIRFTTKRVSLWIENESAEFTINELLAVSSRCGLLCGGCTYRESHGCAGCIVTNGHPFHGECPVAVCCQAKGLEHCGLCPQMPCEKLRDYSCADPEHGDNPPGARLEICRIWASKKSQ